MSEKSQHELNLMTVDELLEELHTAINYLTYQIYEDEVRIVEVYIQKIKDTIKEH